MKKNKHVVLGVTGSIAAYKAADIIRRLIEKGFKVSVIMTKEAEHFITPLTFSSLSGEPVYMDMFSNMVQPWQGTHIPLGDKADILLIAPATANVIGKIACGIADDLLTCTVLSTKAPILVAPAMHPVMYANKAVQDNCQALKKRGIKLVGPVKGKTACGTKGLGHIADVQDIVNAVMRIA